MVAMRGILRACQQYDWSPELYSRVIQLSAYLLYQPLAVVTKPANEEQQQEEEEEGGAAHGGDADKHTRPETAAAAAAAGSQQRLGGRDDWPTPAADSGAFETDERRGGHMGHGSGSQQVVMERVVELGGLEVLVRHICSAPSSAAQCSLMVPLIQVLIPAGKAWFFEDMA